MFPSYEAVAEHDQVADPLAEVTLFKTSMSHADQETMWSHYHDIAHGNPTYFVAYDTGKSLARVSRGLRSFGPHLWENYLRSHHHDVHPKSGVLHFTYNRCGSPHAPPARRRPPPRYAVVELCGLSSSTVVVLRLMVCDPMYLLSVTKECTGHQAPATKRGQTMYVLLVPT